MGTDIALAGMVRRLQCGPNWNEHSLAIGRPGIASAEVNRQTAARTLLKDLSSRRNETSAGRKPGSCASPRAGIRLSLPELCSAIGVPERTLRACCSEFLGMSPTRYHLLRRLNLARSALRRANPETTSVAEIARNHQFLELGRFAVAYRTVFGEMPSFTLRSPRVKTA
ncbi:MAG: helix-turn-helix domain-containing protein [Alphaproteobacteria bacterium]|nr:MAG: helix-turn-helix domain-containing protein [Alphaproteobacteria bacterium]